jgi:UDP-N-acetylglucosamine 2-epimerase (non-hydrolysing)
LADMNLVCIVGARPNFMKIAPLLRALEMYPHVKSTLIHTGQHYDENLSDVFFAELGMKQPDISLEVGSGKHGAQTARILERVEVALERGTVDGKNYDRAIVVGDVNSTMATTLAAVKLGIPVAHVEAGLRSFDRSMPEEINRIVTDALSDMLFVSEVAGVDNLRRENQPEEHIHLVGNIMIDTLMRLLPIAKQRGIIASYGLKAGNYGVVTLHRPANVDSYETLTGLLEVLVKTSLEIPLVFPIHPRTQSMLNQFGLMRRLSESERIIVVPALGYVDFLSLTSQAKVIVTDSGGLQEESTKLGIPCLTVRPNTERPITVVEGTSTLVANDPQMLFNNLHAVLEGTYKKGQCPELWDGQASHRIAKILANFA